MAMQSLTLGQNERLGVSLFLDKYLINSCVCFFVCSETHNAFVTTKVQFEKSKLENVRELVVHVPVYETEVEQTQTAVLKIWLVFSPPENRIIHGYSDISKSY